MEEENLKIEVIKGYNEEKNKIQENLKNFNSSGTHYINGTNRILEIDKLLLSIIGK